MALHDDVAKREDCRKFGIGLAFDENAIPDPRREDRTQIYQRITRSVTD